MKRNYRYPFFMVMLVLALSACSESTPEQNEFYKDYLQLRGSFEHDVVAACVKHNGRTSRWWAVSNRDAGWCNF